MDELAKKETEVAENHYRGQTISVIVNLRAKSARRLLAFPAGPVGCYLSKSDERLGRSS